MYFCGGKRDDWGTALLFIDAADCSRFLPSSMDILFFGSSFEGFNWHTLSGEDEDETSLVVIWGSVESSFTGIKASDFDFSGEPDGVGWFAAASWLCWLFLKF